ncbi:MAG: hypothetical protein ACLVHE_01865 [Dialister invisus]
MQDGQFTFRVQNGTLKNEEEALSMRYAEITSMKNSPRRIRNNRAKWLLGFFLAIMAFLIGRLAYVQIFDHARYVALAKNEVEKNEELYSPRGTIYDRNGNQLAICSRLNLIL